jgi:hypothetical protein
LEEAVDLSSDRLLMMMKVISVVLQYEQQNETVDGCVYR